MEQPTSQIITYNNIAIIKIYFQVVSTIYVN
jgi:hypothetical protein